MDEHSDRKQTEGDSTRSWRSMSPLKLWELIRQGEFSDQELDELGARALQELNYDAAEVFLAAAGLRKQDFSFVLRLARQYEALGDFKRAVRILGFGVEKKAPIKEVYLLLGKLQERRKEYEKSLAAYKQAVELFPSLSEDPEYLEGIERAKRKIELKSRVSSRIIEAPTLESQKQREEPPVPLLDIVELKDSGDQDSAERALRKWSEALRKKNLAAYLECYHPESRLYKEQTFEDLGRIYYKARDFMFEGTAEEPESAKFKKVVWFVADLSIPKWVSFQSLEDVWFITFMEHLSDDDLTGV